MSSRLVQIPKNLPDLGGVLSQSKVDGLDSTLQSILNSIYYVESSYATIEYADSISSSVSMLGYTVDSLSSAYNINFGNQLNTLWFPYTMVGDAAWYTSLYGTVGIKFLAYNNGTYGPDTMNAGIAISNDGGYTNSPIMDIGINQAGGGLAINDIGYAGGTIRLDARSIYPFFTLFNQDTNSGTLSALIEATRVGDMIYSVNRMQTGAFIVYDRWNDTPIFSCGTIDQGLQMTGPISNLYGDYLQFNMAPGYLVWRFASDGSVPVFGMSSLESGMGAYFVCRNSFASLMYGASYTYFQVEDSNGNPGDFKAANITALTAFSGNGSGITNLNASNIATGTIANVRTTATNASTANTIVSRDAAGDFNTRFVWGKIKGACTTATNANYSVLSTDRLVLVSTGATGRTMTLPAASGVSGLEFTIKKIDSGAGTVTVATAVGNIDGGSTFTLSAQWKYVTLISNGSQYYVIANN